MRHSSLERRLERHSIPEPNSGCMLWTGCMSKDGYGRIGFEGKARFAHRMAWFVANGPIPLGKLVCHKCDVPSCINPAHLFLGTDADNAADKVSKGRQARLQGELCGTSKLTENGVLEIHLYPAGITRTAAVFGVSRSLVGAIRQRKVWAHVPR